MKYIDAIYISTFVKENGLVQLQWLSCEHTAKPCFMTL